MSRCSRASIAMWVTSEEDGAVFVIDLPSHKVLTSIPVGPRPRSVAFLPDGSVAYVPSENGATITVIDTRALKATKTIDLGKGMRPMGTAISRDGKELYVTTGRSKMLLIVDTATNAVIGSLEAGARPWGIAVSADGKTAYTANGPSNEVAAIDLASRRVISDDPCRPRAVGRCVRLALKARLCTAFKETLCPILRLGPPRPRPPGPSFAASACAWPWC